MLCLPMQTLIYSNGLTYYGQTTIALTGIVIPHGYGTLYYPNGTFFRGNFVQNRRHGWGHQYDATIQRDYVGEFLDDREEGYAIVTRIGENGEHRVYTGYVSNSRRHGPGKQTETRMDGWTVVFEGTWQNDVLHGWGTHTTTTAAGACYRYEGNFVNGILEGNGYMYDRLTGQRWSVWYAGGSVTQWQ